MKTQFKGKRSKFAVLISVVLCMSMLFSGNVFAEDTVEDGNDDGVHVQLDKIPDDYDPKEFEEANNALVEIGKKASLRRTAEVCTINKFYQGQESWSNDLMKTLNLTIGNSGCTVTSFAMMLKAYGYNDNPGQVNTKIGINACPFEYIPAGNAYNLRVINHKFEPVSRSYAINFITGAISTGNPVLVGMSSSTGGTHFVAAYGYATNMQNPSWENDIYIKDPTRSRDYTSLSQYLNAGWTVNRLYVYDN